MKQVIWTIMVFSLVCAGCQTFVFKKEFVQQTKRILLLNFEVSAHAKKRANVQYPETGFIHKVLYEGWIHQFKEHMQGIQLVTLSHDTLEKANIDIEQKVSLAHKERAQGIEWVFEEDVFSEDELERLLNVAACEAYMTVEVNISVWHQSLDGLVMVKLPNKTLIWKQRLKERSAYIIQDKDSPYSIELGQFFTEQESPSDHKQEIIRMYQEVALSMVESVQKSYQKRLFKEKRDMSEGDNETDD